jgi:hypothetical protein
MSATAEAKRHAQAARQTNDANQKRHRARGVGPVNDRTTLSLRRVK